MKIEIHEWTDNYLAPKVDKDLYVWSSQGQDMLTLLPKICDMETSIGNVDKILTLLQKRLIEGFNIRDLKAFDCSGLFMKFAIDKGLFKSDMTANDIWNSIPNKIPLKDVQIGDFLFEGNDLKKNHIGYAIDHTYAIEARGRAYGVVKTVIVEREWKYAARPYWWSGITPEKDILTRELYLQDPMMRGDDVEAVQRRLNELNYNCGVADGIFGKKTDIAVRNFQTDKSLTVDGIVGKNTATALGFIWRENG